MTTALEVAPVLSKSHTFLLHRAYEKVANTVMSRILLENGLEIKDIWVIVTVGKAPNLNQKQLSEMLVINQNSMVKIVNKLEKMRFMRRSTRSGNRRERILNLTEKGTRVCKEWENLIELSHYKFLEPLTPAEVDTFRFLLIKFVQS